MIRVFIGVLSFSSDAAKRVAWLAQEQARCRSLHARGSVRAAPQGRFRGEKMLYAEAEYRWTMTANGLFGMVAFANTETLSNDLADEKLFDSFATGAGFGFRFMLNKRSKTNLCFDIGFGQHGSSGVYFGVQEAF